MAKMEIKELFNAIYDALFRALRVTDVGSDNKVLVDESAAPATTYVGSVARGTAASATGWLLTKIVVSGTTTTITHAIDNWDNRATATYS